MVTPLGSFSSVRSRGRATATSRRTASSPASAARITELNEFEALESQLGGIDERDGHAIRNVTGRRPLDPQRSAPG